MDLDKASEVCFHDFFGYCRNHKEKDGCPHGHHLKITCEMGTDCNDTICRQNKRHPRRCKWHNLQGFCKLQDTCRYNHFSISSSISDLKSLLEANTEQLEQLKSSFENLKSISNKKAKSTIKELNCDICKKDFVSQSGLTRHIKAKHSGPKIQPIDLFNDKEIKACGLVDNEKDKTEKGHDAHNKDSKHEKEPSKSEIKDVKDNDSETDSNSDSDNEDNITCSHDDNEKSKKQNRKSMIALSVFEKLKSYQQKQERDEIEQDKFLKIPRHYKNFRHNKTFKHDNSLPPLFSMDSENLMITLTFNRVSDFELDHLEHDDVGKIEVNDNDDDKDKNLCLTDEDENSNPGHDTICDDYDDHFGHEDQHETNGHNNLESCNFAQIIERNMSEYF